MDDRILRPLTRMYGHLRRRFKVAGSVGEEFIATNGILQGCPVSVVLVNALMSVWSRAVEAEVERSRTESYADDKQALVSSRRAVTRVATITQEFANLTGQRINAASLMPLPRSRVAERLCVCKLVRCGGGTRSKWWARSLRFRVNQTKLGWRPWCRNVAAWRSERHFLALVSSGVR